MISVAALSNHGAWWIGLAIALVAALANPVVNVSAPNVRRPLAPAPPITPQVLGPIEQVTAQMWPGVPVIPFLLPGARFDDGVLEMHCAYALRTDGMYNDNEIREVLMAKL